MFAVEQFEVHLLLRYADRLQLAVERSGTEIEVVLVLRPASIQMARIERAASAYWGCLSISTGSIASQRSQTSGITSPRSSNGSSTVPSGSAEYADA